MQFRRTDLLSTPLLIKRLLLFILLVPGLFDNVMKPQGGCEASLVMPALGNPYQARCGFCQPWVPSELPALHTQFAGCLWTGAFLPW